MQKKLSKDKVKERNTFKIKRFIDQTLIPCLDFGFRHALECPTCQKKLFEILDHATETMFSKYKKRKKLGEGDEKE